MARLTVEVLVPVTEDDLMENTRYLVTLNNYQVVEATYSHKHGLVSIDYCECFDDTAITMRELRKVDLEV